MNDDQKNRLHLATHNQAKIEAAYHDAVADGMAMPVIFVLDLSDEAGLEMARAARHPEEDLQRQIAASKQGNTVPTAFMVVPFEIAVKGLWSHLSAEHTSKLTVAAYERGLFYVVVIGSEGTMVLTPKQPVAKGLSPESRAYNHTLLMVNRAHVLSTYRAAANGGVKHPVVFLMDLQDEIGFQLACESIGKAKAVKVKRKAGRKYIPVLCSVLPLNDAGTQLQRLVPGSKSLDQKVYAGGEFYACVISASATYVAALRVPVGDN
jgi:hypothetical protein